MALFVVSIDGPDFCGKTTTANLLVELMKRKKNYIVFKTRLPSDLITGSFSKILRNSRDKASPLVFALAFACDHLYHYEKFIKPLKEKSENIILIQERSLLSTYIYQSLIGNVELSWLREINKFDKNIPDLTLILKVNKEELIKRKKVSQRGYDEFETNEFLEKQIKVYYNLPKELQNEFNVVYVDANKDAFEVAKECMKIIEEKFLAK